MVLNLREEILFEDDELDINKRITFIYGKNGTGKSTLTNIIRRQCCDYDVRIFQGFENVIDENKRLNAVVLGKENTLIRHQIEEIEGQIQVLEREKISIQSEIEQPADNTVSNYWTRSKDAQNVFEKKEGEIKSFYTKAAATIKNQRNPQISSTSYDTRAFQRDIPNATLMDEKERKQCIELLKSEAKLANNIVFPNIALWKLFEDVNAILQYKVEEKVKVLRLENHPGKRKFADEGRKIHKRGEVCAFCGNLINDSVFEELEKYFSADEVRAFQINISERLKLISSSKKMVEDVELNENNFYPEFLDDLLKLKQCMDVRKKEYIMFLTLLENALKDKLSYLFESVEILKVELPTDFSEIRDKYDELKEKNNKNDLLNKQEKARESLRLHFVKEQLEIFEYVAKTSELNVLKRQKDSTYKELVEEQDKLTGENGINEQINKLKEKIVKLQEGTKNEKLLAQNINKKLRHMVSFELEHCEDEEEKGYYLVKNIQTNVTRNITELSTGEKNIIAFLYFIEKLNEIQEEKTEKRKIILFDDPMNSNDDNMQYLIIEELQLLMKQIKKDDQFILLTHNNHFYLNVKYSHKYKEDLFLRFQSNGEKTTISIITKEEEDFSTSYHTLWKELIFLYKNTDTSPGMLLNPMRRIIETYTNFNAIGHNAFCAKKRGAMKLFNVNSHSIDDLEADLCGKEKIDIGNIFCECFYLNGALKHFQSFWPDYDIGFLDMSEED